MKFPLCPRCKTKTVHRVPRIGLVEILSSLFYRYPFQCDRCSYRFSVVQWGCRYQQLTERRVTPRFPVLLPVTISGDHVQGQGTVVNLSARGCRMSTAAPVPAGRVLRLKIHGTDGQPLFEISEAAVRSVQGNQAGFEFLKISEDAIREFKKILGSLYSEQYA